MDPALKTVTRLPLRNLWRADGFATTSRIRSLAEDDITVLLGVGPVEFVVVDVGFAPTWIPLGDCYQFWKSEVKPHLAVETRAIIANLSGGYCYFASQWDSREAAVPIVVLEKSH
jgi:hypothetical protein